MVRVTEDNFGSAINPFSKQTETIRRFTLANDMQMEVQVITLGATITSFKVPDAWGKVDDITLGYDDIPGYQSAGNPYFGATVGRVCNRIGNARFPLAGREVQVARNFQQRHQLHGGFIGFDKAHWVVAAVRTDGVSLEHRNPDGHEGYPGELLARVDYTLTEDNCLHVRMTAQLAAGSDVAKTTVVNMTNHAYFNLAGHSAGRDALLAHEIQIKASHITETDDDSIPTGKLLPVDGGAFDLRALDNLGARLPPKSGYDDNFCVDLLNSGNIATVAKAYHPPSGRWLEVATNQPGVQFYTSNGMPDPQRGEAAIIGKGGAAYVKQCAFCLETQKWPDAPNQPNFPSITLEPGQLYEHEVIYKFGVCRSGGCQA